MFFHQNPCLLQVHLLPSSHVKVGQLIDRPFGTTITILASSVLKHVDLRDHPLLSLIALRMQRVYAAAQHCPNLISAVKGYPTIVSHLYTVELRPAGMPLHAGSVPAESLRDAVK